MGAFIPRGMGEQQQEFTLWLLGSEFVCPGFAPGLAGGGAGHAGGFCGSGKRKGHSCGPLEQSAAPWAPAGGGDPREWGSVPARGAGEALPPLQGCSQGPAALPLPQASPSPSPEDEIASMADSSPTIDDIEGELFRIGRIREMLVRRESELRYM